jgi:hypothetical protein
LLLLAYGFEKEVVVIGYLRWLLIFWVALVSGISEAEVTGGCVGWSLDDDRDGRTGIWVEEVRVAGLTNEGAGSDGKHANHETDHELNYIMDHWEKFEKIVAFYKHGYAVDKPW